MARIPSGASPPKGWQRRKSFPFLFGLGQLHPLHYRQDQMSSPECQTGKRLPELGKWERGGDREWGREESGTTGQGEGQGIDGNLLFSTSQSTSAAPKPTLTLQNTFSVQKELHQKWIKILLSVHNGDHQIKNSKCSLLKMNKSSMSDHFFGHIILVNIKKSCVFNKKKKKQQHKNVFYCKVHQPC